MGSHAHEDEGSLAAEAGAAMRSLRGLFTCEDHGQRMSFAGWLAAARADCEKRIKQDTQEVP